MLKGLQARSGDLQRWWFIGADKQVNGKHNLRLAAFKTDLHQQISRATISTDSLMHLKC